MGVQFQTETSTDPSFNTVIFSTRSYSTYLYREGMAADTLYYFHVKVATESDTAYLSNTLSARTLPRPS